MARTYHEANSITGLRERLLNGEVIVNIGQVTPEAAKQLNKWVKGGQLSKWRGKWYPVAGASYGLGPDKTCWALPEVHASLAGF